MQKPNQLADNKKYCLLASGPFANDKPLTGETKGSTSGALTLHLRNNLFAIYGIIEIQMQKRTMTSFVGLMMLIGTSCLAETGNSVAGKAQTAEASRETENTEGLASDSEGSDELESSNVDTSENGQVSGDIALGEMLYQETCKNCHGPKAKGMASFPKLAGREAEYLVERLTAYRAGEKVGPNSALMAPMAADLSDDDIASLALYISETFE